MAVLFGAAAAGAGVGATAATAATVGGGLSLGTIGTVVGAGFQLFQGIQQANAIKAEAKQEEANLKLDLAQKEAVAAEDSLDRTRDLMRVLAAQNILGANDSVSEDSLFEGARDLDIRKRNVRYLREQTESNIFAVKQGAKIKASASISNAVGGAVGSLFKSYSQSFARGY